MVLRSSLSASVHHTTAFFDNKQALSVCDEKSKPIETMGIATEQGSPTETQNEHLVEGKPWSDYSGGVQARVTEGPGIYYFGIIDMLQDWNFWKRGERFLKTKFLRKNPDGLSAIDPLQYQRRFMERMHQIIKDENEYFDSSKIDSRVFK